LLKARLQLNANQGHFGVNSFQTGNVPQLGFLGGVKGSGVEAVFAGIPVTFLATAPPFGLCFVCGHVLKNLSCAT